MLDKQIRKTHLRPLNGMIIWRDTQGAHKEVEDNVLTSRDNASLRSTPQAKDYQMESSSERCAFTRSRLGRITVFSLFLICSVLEGLYCYKRSFATFDTVAYASIAEYTGSNNFDSVARQCIEQIGNPHSDCDNLLPDANGLVKLTGGFSDADFAIFLRLYRVKFLFVTAAAFLHNRMHLGSFNAIRLLSSSSFVLTSLVVWTWLRSHMSPVTASLIALLTMSLPEVIKLGKSMTPDAFGGLFLITAVWLLTSTRYTILGSATLVLSILARPDTIIFATLFAFALIFRRRDSLSMKVKWLALITAGLAILYLVQQRATHALPWSSLFYTSFIDYAYPAQLLNVHLGMRAYLRAIAFYASNSIMANLVLPTFLTSLTLLFTNRSHWVRDLLLACTIATVFRLLLYPNMESRFYTWFLIFACVGLSVSLAQRNTHDPIPSSACAGNGL